MSLLKGFTVRWNLSHERSEIAFHISPPFIKISILASGEANNELSITSCNRDTFSLHKFEAKSKPRYHVKLMNMLITGTLLLFSSSSLSLSPPLCYFLSLFGLISLFVFYFLPLCNFLSLFLLISIFFSLTLSLFLSLFSFVSNFLCLLYSPFLLLSLSLTLFISYSLSLTLYLLLSLSLTLFVSSSLLFSFTLFLSFTLFVSLTLSLYLFLSLSTTSPSLSPLLSH